MLPGWCLYVSDSNLGPALPAGSPPALFSPVWLLFGTDRFVVFLALLHGCGALPRIRVMLLLVNEKHFETYAYGP